MQQPFFYWDDLRSRFLVRELSFCNMLEVLAIWLNYTGARDFVINSGEVAISKIYKGKATNREIDKLGIELFRSIAVLHVSLESL